MKIIPLLLAGLSGLAFASEAAAAENPPKGLAASDWSSIRAAYEAGRHAIHRKDNGTLTARNPGQQWRTEFDGKGFLTTPDHGQWTWGLELTAYGERTLLSASSYLTHEGGKISCQRDAYLTEWFINDTRGLEQGWTIHSRSVGSLPTSKNLTLTLALRGDLQAHVSPDSSSVSFQTESGGTALTYAGLKAWDADGTNLLVRFEPAGENAIRIAVEDQNARYPIIIDPIAQQAYLKASNTGAGDYFGYSVAVSGDTVVVGAIGENYGTTGVNSPPNGSATDSGAAYVFTRSATTWSQQAYLKASNTGASDAFGNTVAVSGDTLVVGAYNEDSSTTGVNSTPNENASQSGAAYVFARSGATWSQHAYLKASNSGVGKYFGRSVAVSGDTVVVGADWEDSSTTGVNSTPNESATSSGAAYVFDLNAVLPIPEIAVQQAGTDIATSTTKPFGPVAIGGNSDLVFAILNTAAADLTLSGTPKVAVTGSPDFTVTAQPVSRITGPSGSSNFTVRFTPSGSGLKTASLSIANNDDNENPFIIELTGTSATAMEVFNEAIATGSGLTEDDALPTAIPFDDGVENVLKYAFNMNLAGPDTQTIIPGTGTAGLPSVTLDSDGPVPMLQIEFLRRKDSGLIYTPMRSPTLLPGSFVPVIISPPDVTSIDGVWERVVVQEPADLTSSPRGFVTVEVTIPE